MLKALREQRQMSQQQLAEQSGVGIATIKRIESSTGVRLGRSISASRLASALQVKVTDLSEDNFKRVIDIGGDMELHLDRFTDVEILQRESEKLINLVDARNRYLNGIKAKSTPD
jgi:transcriptional regulator with XRE-family HTH domain